MYSQIRNISVVLVLVFVLTLVGSVATGGIVFLDDFEDGSATDGAPVTWSPVSGATGSYEVIDGNYVLTCPTDDKYIFSNVHQYTLADTSIRTQARLIGSNALWFGLGARSKPGVGAYVALLRNNAQLRIWRFGRSPSDSWMLASADVGIDPRAQDVLLRFDVIGNELRAWAWREGDPMPAEPQVTAVHSEFATGEVGVGADLSSRLSNNEAIFRYVEVYEPIPPSPDFNGEWSPEGAWITSVPTPLGNMIVKTTLMAQDAAKTRFTVEIEQISGYPVLIDIYPDLEETKYGGGLAQKIGLNKYEITHIQYFTKTSGPGLEEIVGIGIVNGTFEFVGPDLAQGQGTGAYYMAAQDADQDGFPDEGQEPVVCVPWGWTSKRLTMIPGCVPTPLPE